MDTGHGKMPHEMLSQLADIVHDAEDPIIGKTLEGVITSWNRGAEQLYGYREEEAVGASISLIVPPDRKDELVSILRVIASGDPVRRLQTVRIARNGDRISVLLNIMPVRNHLGEIVGGVTFTKDITSQRRSEQEVARLESVALKRQLVLETAQRVALDILASKSGITALMHIADTARSLSGARYAALGVARPDGQGLSEFVTSGLTVEQEAAIGPRPTGKGVLGYLLSCRAPLRIANLATHPNSYGFPRNHPPME
ncbi:MAG TPA: PAS domain S-box protein, partial [Chthonomonadales bacterium]|nr:PAS domain S-box protein [Chthonomonadales bacterium]